MAYFPSEFKSEELTTGEIVQRGGTNGDDFSMPIKYDGRPLFLQLNDVRIVFGLMSYTTPQGNYQRFSTGICADYMDDLTVDCFEQIEQWVKERAPQSDEGGVEKKYFSFIRTNQHGRKHIRVKVPSTRNDRLNLMMYVNDREYCKPRTNTFTQYIEHNTIANVIIKLGGLWSSGDKYGVSFTLDSIIIQPRQFRSA